MLTCLAKAAAASLLAATLRATIALCASASASPPRLRYVDGAAQLVLDGKPFLVLGGELGNFPAGTAAQADGVLPPLAARHFNTVLMPVAWSEIEPAEWRFDFSILDHWIAVGRQQRLHLVILWFGSWKNASRAVRALGAH